MGGIKQRWPHIVDILEMILLCTRVDFDVKFRL